MDKKGLLHEAGHLLGLVHCTNRTCLMNSYVYLRRVLLGQQKKLCPECSAELAQSFTQPSPSNLRFVDSVVVRSEAGYNVLSLPDRLCVIVGDLAEQHCQDFAAAIRAETPDGNQRLRVDYLANDDVLKEPLKLSQMINRLKADPFESVRGAGPKVFLRVCADRYGALGQYTNAVDMLHRAILLDSSDDSSYNQLAWIRATCCDASVRNGKEAVSAASKACELTEWKDWEFIDTLAAAYAEAGDFKRAIEFQQQALRTGNPSESEQKEMRERLSLYELSKPFRDIADKPCQPVRDNPQPVNVRHDTRPRHHGAFPFIQRRRRVGDRPAHEKVRDRSHQCRDSDYSG